MTTATADGKNSHVRFWIIAVLFLVSSINYASRATLGIAGKPLAAEFHLIPCSWAICFRLSAWPMSSARFPAARCWTARFAPGLFGRSPCGRCSPASGLRAVLAFMPALISLFMLRLRWALRNARLSRQCPHRRQLVSNLRAGHGRAIFNASQYFSVVAFTPLMGWLAQVYGWQSVFLAMGGIGLLGAPLFAAVVQSPAHKRINKREFAYIEERRRAGEAGQAGAGTRRSAGTLWASFCPTGCCGASISRNTASRR